MNMVMVVDKGEVSEVKKEKLVKSTKKGAVILDQHLPDQYKTNYHVMEHGGEIYDAMLNQKNLSNNNNKFYVIQALGYNLSMCTWPGNTYCYSGWNFTWGDQRVTFSWWEYTFSKYQASKDDITVHADLHHQWNFCRRQWCLS
ncbi:hypothetical protein MKX03_034590 [Papaver bracteatum]|nr:hypothetical protein MKX03_034590 [Papaver bracteatum]